MTPNINLIPSAHLAEHQYLLWNPVDETWSEPMNFAAAQETAAREPDLQACILMPDGSTSTTAPFAEIFKRAASAPRDIETAAALHQRNERVQAQRAAAPAPQPSPAPARQPSAAPMPRAANQAAAIPAETLTLLRHALRLFLILTYASLYISAASAIIVGLTTGNHIVSIVGIIAGVGILVLHQYLTLYED